jgi:hypothetical protein
MFLKCRFLLVWLVCVVVVLVENRGASEEKSRATGAWRPREFPLVAWGGPQGKLNNEENWKIVKDGNFTVSVSGGANLAEHRKALEICGKLNLPIFAIDTRIHPGMTAKPGWQKVLAETIADYRPYPALYGLYGWDEPASDLFAQVGAMNAEFCRQAPEYLFHLNIFPNYAEQSQLGTPTYREHVEKYVSIVKPQVLCFDNYSVMANGTIRANYFENLAVIRECAVKNGLSTWIFILSGQFHDLADPSEGQMRFQAFTSLAYGMKGILYFTYWPFPPLTKATIVDLEGKPTRLYPIIKRLNGDILAIGDTLLSLTSTGTYHTGPIPHGCARLPLDAPLQLPDEKPLVVGFFDGPGKTQYALVANADPHKAVDFAIAVHPEVKRLFALSFRDGKAVAVALQGGRAAYRLEAGDGRLFRFETEFKYPEPKRHCCNHPPRLAISSRSRAARSYSSPATASASCSARVLPTRYSSRSDSFSTASWPTNSSCSNCSSAPNLTNTSRISSRPRLMVSIAGSAPDCSRASIAAAWTR